MASCPRADREATGRKRVVGTVAFKPFFNKLAENTRLVRIAGAFAAGPDQGIEPSEHFDDCR